MHLSVLVIAFCMQHITACVEVPYHAVIVSSSSCPQWQCRDGYFRTAPPNPLLATCKPCTQLRGCPSGYTGRACAPLNDTACVQCPSQPPPNARFRQGCGDIVCNDGFVIEQPLMACGLCPKASYCQNNTVYTCGENATTIAAGANTRLQCLPSDLAKDGVGMLAVVDFTLQTPIDDAGQCDALTWLQYGMLIGCRFQPRDVNVGLQWSLLCSVVTSHIASTAYAAWLAQQLQTKASFTAAALRACLDTQKLSIMQQSVTGQSVKTMLNTYSFFRPSTVIAQIDGPLDPPELRYEPISWGQQPQDAVAVVASMGIIGTSLPLALAMLVAGLCARRRRRMRMNAVIDKLTAHKRRVLAELSQPPQSAKKATTAPAQLAKKATTAPAQI